MRPQECLEIGIFVSSISKPTSMEEIEREIDEITKLVPPDDLPEWLEQVEELKRILRGEE